MQAKSSGSELAVLAAGGVLECQDDVLFWDTGVYQVNRNAFLRPVLLYPDLAVVQLDVNPDLMNALEAVPAFIHEEKLPVSSVEERQSAEAFWEGVKPGALAQDRFDNLLIVV